MSDTTHYVIRGGREGRERLRLLARVLHATTTALFDRLDLRAGQTCLDVGCGGGDTTVELARRVAPGGRAVGVDIDEVKVATACAEAREQGIENVDFHVADIREASDRSGCDVVYSRFLLTHLSDPQSCVEAFYRHLKPGGTVAVEDIDFSGYFTYPESTALARYRTAATGSSARRSPAHDRSDHLNLRAEYVIPGPGRRACFWSLTTALRTHPSSSASGVRTARARASFSRLPQGIGRWR